MFSFFKGFFGNSVNDSHMEADAARAMGELDIDMAQAAHENWKLRLQTYLDGRSEEELSAETICFDDRCDLGRWIHGPGTASLGRFPGFTALLGHHKMFHYAASNVVALTKAGKDGEARKMMMRQFEPLSGSVMADLDLLRKIAASSKAARQ